MTPNQLAAMLSSAQPQAGLLVACCQLSCARTFERNMLAYAHQRASEALGKPRTAVLVTNGPAGVQAREFPCEVLDLVIYLVVPQTSDHLFNLEHDVAVTLLTTRCELKGTAQIVSRSASDLNLDLWREPAAEWCALVQIQISQVQIRSERGWGNLETIDL